MSSEELAPHIYNTSVYVMFVEKVIPERESTILIVNSFSLLFGTMFYRAAVDLKDASVLHSDTVLGRNINVD